LPAVSRIVRQLKVDYRTVNSALELLEEDGLIRREPGRGKGAVVLKNNTNVRRKCSIAFPRWCGDAIFVAVAKGIEKFAEKNGIGFTMIDAMRSMDRYLDAVAHVPTNINGLILYPWDTPKYRQAVSQAIKSGMKIVFVDRIIFNANTSSVSVDHFGGAYQATKHLIETHNRPVYYFGNLKSPSPVHQRYMGWLEAMREYNGQLDHSKYVCESPRTEGEEVTMPAGKWRQLNRKKILNMLKRKKESKYSIFCVNDETALAVYEAAEEMGLQIGKDVYVVGFGDRPYCENLIVPLTSVIQPDEQTGYEAARLLRDKIENVQRHPVHKVLPAKLKIRASSIGVSVLQKDAAGLTGTL
jgi:LacI family transcriptional regulator